MAWADRAHREQPAPMQLLGVRRWGEDDGARPACGTWSTHVSRGCIGLEWENGRGASGLIHLTAEDALRLSDLLRAMADAS